MSELVKAGGNAMRPNDVRVEYVILNPRIATITDAQKITALISALKELGVDVPQWMPIDTAPKDGTPMLAWIDYDHVLAPNGDIRIIVYSNGEWFYHNSTMFNGTPTHWMPLPTKPKE